ncbi:Hybrid signal transduction histidine kinase A [Colletotrichum spinosum]|uniref:histidine kinase n=1 Tax=Colletotrichum spinosum TaxID=1347390 RepID=A0A4R8PWQ6_9PEZI|nr:Hybrid signal transduction histidine kinase A [Colletotrichum spinosum]
MACLQARQAVSEGRRERETFRYDPSLIAKAVRYDHVTSDPPKRLRSSPDSVLTALAELGVLRLKATRALVSLFDRDYQYIVAEATPSLPLTPDADVADVEGGERLVLCGTAIPRSEGICELALGIASSSQAPHAQDRGEPAHDGSVPVTVIPDITSDSRSSQRAFCHAQAISGPHVFYSGVPIRSPDGIDIGVFCVFDDQPRQGLDDTSVRFLRDISRAVMSHLECRRNEDSHRCADRMVRGIGSFVEGRPTILERTSTDTTQVDAAEDAGTNPGPAPCEKESTKGGNPSSSPVQQSHDSMPLKTSRTYRPGPSPVPVPVPVPNGPDTPTTPARSLSDFRGILSQDPKIPRIFSRAANVVREAIEVDDVVFLDASIASFEGLVTSAPASTGSHHSSSSSSSSSDGGEGEVAPQRHGTGHRKRAFPCRVLGFSNSSASSVEGQRPPRNISSVPERFLSKLLRRYPQGKIFNIDDKGQAESSDLTGDESSVVPGAGTDELAKEAQPPRKRRLNTSSAKNQRSVIAAMFPGARSVAVVPLWDANKQRWYAGGFASSTSPTRFFSVQHEMSYLRAFSVIIMSEVDRVNSSLVEQSKNDLLNSLSHELRSPLHGVILGTELLYDTPLDTFQGETLVSIENCGRTLLETIDHMLDWSKINNFIGPSSRKPSATANTTTAKRTSTYSDWDARGTKAPGKALGIEAGMMSIMSDVCLDVLAEEVVDSVCAGFSYQRLSAANMVNDAAAAAADGTSIDDAIRTIRRLDNMQAFEYTASRPDKTTGALATVGDVPVTFDVSPAISWAFRSQPGAIRRIIMNLLGNSLKYTNRGFINVSMLRIPPDTPEEDEELSINTGIKIVVTDTGRGIGKEYLHTRLFVPFSQEDSLSAGTGLGLSLVNQIVGKLGGSIHVWSQVGQGTKVTVTLKLREAEPPSPTGDPASAGFDEFTASIGELKGLRIRLHGIPTQEDVRGALDPELAKGTLSEASLIANICLDWLQMHVVEDLAEDRVLPDMILSTEASLHELLHEQRRTGVFAPVVVICRNSLIARQLATSPRFASGRAGFDFISQPVGPRKLAKVLLMSFRRWITLQASSIPTPSQVSTNTADMFSIDPSPKDGQPVVAGHLPSSGEGADALSELPAEERETLKRRREVTQEIESDRGNNHQGDDVKEKTDGKTEDSADGVAKPTNKHSTMTLRPSPSAKPPKQHRGSGTRFLLVDDNPININILAASMRKLNHGFDSARNGKEALDRFEAAARRDDDAERFRVVLMDISMPVMDGFESTRRIRAVERELGLARCKIFALTGLASAAAQQEAFASGVDLFLTKPVRLKELSRILDENIGV